jgi:hypothetical protein
MVKFYDTNFTYAYSFPAVTLAYFLRYPNPMSTHVLSSDVIDRSFDPQTGLLKTTRVHLKKSRLPGAVVRLLPASAASTLNNGQSSSYVLETSTVDIKNGTMETETRNLNWTGILSVTERSTFTRIPGVEGGLERDPLGDGTTHVAMNIKFRSRLGDKMTAKFRDRMEARRAAHAAQNPNSSSSGEETDHSHDTHNHPPHGHTSGTSASHSSYQDEDDEPKKGFLATWTTAGVQRSIEAIASRKTIDGQNKSREGMQIVLERLRSGGLVGVLEGMRHDRMVMMGGKAVEE